MTLLDGAGRPLLTYEVARLRARPCQWTVRGITSDYPKVEIVQISADPNPMPHIRLWGRRRG